MKFLQLTGITVLLSQATSISVALLVPRSSDCSSTMSDPLANIKARINAIKLSGRALVSPNTYCENMAIKYKKPYFIPMKMEDDQNENNFFITSDGTRDLNYVVVTSSDGEVICHYRV
ncbi:BgTH12-03402 [Blumeria graminis f. sp. triticale]|uniref:Bgt-51872 n=2 Tax=Blumeria graminis TaxID=34373 RepID=A0A9X9L7W9_BLUGR|nr:BgTH12-03402 [Blumeria graminis f. sp. triticale]VCU39405.1 Bgt-51872 [Blumeria graminis f. sp. tritici]